MSDKLCVEMMTRHLDNAGTNGLQHQVLSCLTPWMQNLSFDPRWKGELGKPQKPGAGCAHAWACGIASSSGRGWKVGCNPSWAAKLCISPAFGKRQPCSMCSHFGIAVLHTMPEMPAPHLHVVHGYNKRGVCRHLEHPAAEEPVHCDLQPGPGP